MKRAWSQNCGEEGTAGAQVKATALGCLADENYVRASIAILEALMAGASVRIVADRPKVDPATGEPLEDYTEPGEYVTVAYHVEVGDDDGEHGWSLDRVPEAEGSQSALGFAGALASIADEEFCESMAHLKAALDRLGGQAFVKPYVRDDRVVGFMYRYEHLVRGQAPEPDAVADAPPEPPDEPDDDEPTAEELDAAAEAPPAGDDAELSQETVPAGG